MAEKEYIERGALLERLKKTPRYFDVKFDVLEAPAADVVEVVRCLKCVYWDGMGYEGRCESPVNGLIREYTSYDDFCSYGERKSEI